MDPRTRELYLADAPPTVARLDIAQHFEALTEKQKLYAHHISRASFLGTRITLRQVSPESEAIYDLITALYHACKGDWKALAERTGTSDQDLTSFMEYATQFLGNLGNYKGFGDSKFLPRLSHESLTRLASGSPECGKALGKATTAGLGLYGSEEIRPMHLGYTEDGKLTTYYPDSPDITKDEISSVGDLLEKKKLLLENTRLRKTPAGDFELLIASAQDNPAPVNRDCGDTEYLELEGKPSGRLLRLVFGDYSTEMQRISVEAQQAIKYADNDIQRSMHEQYQKSFQTGSIQAFKESQRCWIKDKGPAVECNYGFIETYRDPHGVRGEWEGFVAMVNQERTRAFGRLVESASSMIPKLPWSSDFEKDDFLSPDFTSLEVLTFCGSGIPAGINIPNYDDVRQNLGFKNVSLGNVLSAKSPIEPVPFIREADLALYRSFRDPAFEVQVGIHELLGHGTGKLLQETEAGVYNFDQQNPPLNPVTDQPVSTWYKPGQTWSSVFGPIASSYEECRAECVAMALSCDFEILKIFGFGNGEQNMHNEAGDVLYVAYLQMARAGIAALEYWDPKSRKWGQAHMQARFSILRAFLEAGDHFVRLETDFPDNNDDDDDAAANKSNNTSDLKIHLDRNRILSHGRPAVEKYLQKLHIYKSTADVEAGTKLYNDVTDVDQFWEYKVRPVVLNRRTPRKVFVQANTELRGGKVVLKEYEPTMEGMVRSWAERHV